MMSSDVHTAELDLDRETVTSTALSRLELQVTSVSDESISVLATLSGLTELPVHGTRMTRDGVMRLHRLLPTGSIKF